MPTTKPLVRTGRRVGVGLGPGVKVGGMGITRVLVGVGGRGVQVDGRVGVTWIVGLDTTAGGRAVAGSPLAPHPGKKPKLSNTAKVINSRRVIAILAVGQRSGK